MITMFQRLTNLLFGSVIETTQEVTVPKPGSPEVDDEGWLLVNASGQCVSGDRKNN